VGSGQWAVGSGQKPCVVAVRFGLLPRRPKSGSPAPFAFGTSSLASRAARLGFFEDVD
jgi:hypothetical protein